jgi:class 3 adenylate cyclase
MPRRSRSPPNVEHASATGAETRHPSVPRGVESFAGDPGAAIARNSVNTEDAGRARAGARRTERELATVLFTDLVESTVSATTLGDRAWAELLERHHAVVRRTLREYRGVEVDTAGDGFYATFDGPARAIECARRIAASIEELGLAVRAGIHTGECEMIDGKPGGITVVVGSRVAALAGASDVLVTQTVKDLVAGSGLTFEDAGEHELKGVPDRWRLYRVGG